MKVVQLMWRWAGESDLVAGPCPEIKAHSNECSPRGTAQGLVEGRCLVDPVAGQGLLRAGAPPDAVDHLQGHVIAGSRGRYIDANVAYDLVEVVGRVP
ncbi:MAG: hypothetical protein AAGA48_02750, partial [Myxococcota bacterium]